MKIFGREPAVIIGAIGTLITLFVSFKIPGFSAGIGAALTALITAIITAVTTRPIGPSLFVAIVVPASALFYQYGVHLSDQMIAALSAVILAGFTLFGVRAQVTPKADPAPTTPASGDVR